MGKMKELWMEEMERLEEKMKDEATNGKVEVAQKERRLENRLEEEESKEDNLLGKD